MTEQEDLIEKIVEYIREEDFPVKHVRTLLNFTRSFNISEVTENFIFECEKELNGLKYKENLKYDYGVYQKPYGVEK